MRESCRQPSDRRGFTLLEVLVSVAVITLLVAILLPALRGARVLGWRAACQSNLRQLAIAWHGYTGDYDVLPTPRRHGSWLWGGATFTGPAPSPQSAHTARLSGERPINEYLNAKDGAAVLVYRCPADVGLDDGSSPASLTLASTSRRDALLGATQPTANTHQTPARPLGVDLARSPNESTFYGSFGTSYRGNDALLTPMRLTGLPLTAGPVLEGPVRMTDLARPTATLIAGDAGWAFEAARPDSSLAGKSATWHGAAGAGHLLTLDGGVHAVGFEDAPMGEAIGSSFILR